MSDADFDYQKTFDPKGMVHRREVDDATTELRRDPVYVYEPEIVLAINVALATRRPILVRGASGTGKSSLARSAASQLEWRYYETTITSRTEARDLLYEVDLLRRLQDAQQGALEESYEPYIVPGVLWKAFLSENPEDRAVVLLDEIDKADPDVPNNMLTPLGALAFEVEETGKRVATSEDAAPLVFLTTNEERELPPAFLRRCVELKLPDPTPARLIAIAKEHHPQSGAWIEEVAKALFGELTDEVRAQPVKVSPAEFLDTVVACERLEITPRDDAWQALSSTTVWKHGRKGSDG